MNPFDQFKNLAKRLAKVWLTLNDAESTEQQHEAADHLVKAAEIGIQLAQEALAEWNQEKPSVLGSRSVTSALAREIAEEMKGE